MAKILQPQTPYEELTINFAFVLLAYTQWLGHTHTHTESGRAPTHSSSIQKMANHPARDFAEIKTSSKRIRFGNKFSCRSTWHSAFYKLQVWQRVSHFHFHTTTTGRNNIRWEYGAHIRLQISIANCSRTYFFFLYCFRLCVELTPPRTTTITTITFIHFIHLQHIANVYTRAPVGMIYCHFCHCYLRLRKANSDDDGVVGAGEPSSRFLLCLCRYLPLAYSIYETTVGPRVLNTLLQCWREIIMFFSSSYVRYVNATQGTYSVAGAIRETIYMLVSLLHVLCLRGDYFGRWAKYWGMRNV